MKSCLLSIVSALASAALVATLVTPAAAKQPRRGVSQNTYNQMPLASPSGYSGSANMYGCRDPDPNICAQVRNFAGRNAMGG